jgi:recombinational DNA repair protein (RecF pathway)
VSLGLDGCEVRLCDPCARLCPCVLCVSRLPPVSFYRYSTQGVCNAFWRASYLSCLLARELF